MSDSSNKSHDAHGGDQASGHGHKKKHHQHGHGDHPEHEEGWIVSFADNVLLMMGFFVILLAMNMGPKAEVAPGAGNNDGGYSDRLIDLAIAVREGFNSPVDMASTDPNDAPLIRRKKELAADGGRTKQRGTDGPDTTSAGIKTSEWYRLFGRAYFNDFETTLNDEGRRSLEEVADRLRGQRWVIEVRGHASAAESNGNPDRAMRLSYDRAAAVAAQLVKEGLSREQMRIVACGDHQRSTPRADTSEGHRNNQRVEIITTYEELSANPYRARPLNRDDDDADPGSKP